MEICSQRDVYRNVASNSIHGSRKLETTQMSISWGMGQGWMSKLWYAHTAKYDSAIKRRELLIHRTWMTLEGIMLSESTQVQKVIYYVVAFI